MDAFGGGRVVTSGDDARPVPGRTAALWLTTAVLAATWTPQLQAQDLGPSPDTSARFERLATGDPPESRSAEEQDRQAAEMLGRELEVTRNEVDALLKLLNEQRDEIADVRKALQGERDRASRLEQGLAAARRGVEMRTTPAAKADDEASQLKKAVDASTADLRKSLQQERDRALRLEQDLATARRDVETQTALAAKAGEEAGQLKKTSDEASADLRKSLQQEHERASRLEQELAAARRDVETQTALAARAGDEASQLKTAAAAGAADLQESLQQERDRTSRLEQDLVAARRDVETQTALAIKASDETSQLKKTAEAGTADSQKALQQERNRANRLEQDLAAARRDVETQTALAAKVSDEASQLKKTADAGATDSQRALQQERDRANRLEQDLAAARRDIEAQKALATKAGDEASQLKKTAEASTADLQKALQQERDRASRLEQDLASARRNVETQTALATKAGHESIRLKQDLESGSMDLRPSLRPEQNRVARPEPALAPSKENARAPSVPVTTGISRQSEPEVIAGLMARANALLRRGDIGSARIVLERAAEAGNAEASFRLAETYDPVVLSKWGTFGTRGDAMKALDLYARARAGGIMEAKERLDALRP